MDHDDFEASEPEDDRQEPAPAVPAIDAATLADRWLVMLRDLARTLPSEEVHAV